MATAERVNRSRREAADLGFAKKFQCVAGNGRRTVLCRDYATFGNESARRNAASERSLQKSDELFRSFRLHGAETFGRSRAVGSSNEHDFNKETKSSLIRLRQICHKKAVCALAAGDFKEVSK